MLLRKGIMPLHSSIVGSLTVSMLIIMMLTFASELYGQTQESDSDPTLSPYESGYVHGCDDARITDFSARYINQPEKGPNFHTDEFMRGYDAGYNACFE
jgi:hypothetical protein